MGLGQGGGRLGASRTGAGAAGSCAVLCRNNAPLVALALKLLRQGVQCAMANQDFGRELLALTKRLCPLDDTPADECRANIRAWRTDAAATAAAAAAASAAATAAAAADAADAVEDRAACLLSLLEGGNCGTAGALHTLLMELFSATADGAGAVMLSTGHKAKGLEWDLVVHLNPMLIPSERAIAAHAKEQVPGHPTPSSAQAHPLASGSRSQDGPRAGTAVYITVQIKLICTVNGFYYLPNKQ